MRAKTTRRRPFSKQGARYARISVFASSITRSSRPLVSWLRPRIGPKGLEFARARVEMKAIEAVLHLRQQAPRRLKSMVPDHVWALVRPDGLAPQPDEESKR